jgi:hypothetical protein
MKYRTLRNLHLFLGLFFILFLLMYGASSVQMAHPTWFDSKPTVTEARLPFPAEEAYNARAIAATLIEQQAVRGELKNVAETEDGYTFRVVRPGTVHEVEYVRGEDSVLVRTSVAGFMGMLNRIHHIGGVHHEYPLLNVWGVLVFLTSLGLILLGLSGAYMWFKSHRTRRTAGVLLLGVSLTASVTLIILMRMA